MKQLKTLLAKLLANDKVARVFHTFWQAAGGALLAGVLVAHSTNDVRAALTVAIAAGLAAVKALVVRG